MAEYIDRQEVIKKLEELDTRLMRGHYYDECEGVAMTKAIVNGVPAADVKKVVHGHWIRQDESFTRFKCSNPECGIENCSGFENYCPNCGAKMDEEDTQQCMT